MIIDARDLGDGERVTGDVCIVGAGAAGMTLAMELSGNGLDVVLLESGGLGSNAEVGDMNAGRDLGSGWRNTQCRARYFGGSTNLWVGWCRPLDPEDFGPRPWIGDISWPFGRADLDPFYDRARVTLEIGADDFDPVGAADRLGYELFDFDPERFDTVMYQFSPPTRFGQVYRGVIDGAEDIRCYLFATVVNIATNEGEDSVARLECATIDGNALTVEADTYVLAMGGIENPRVMLASRERNPAGVGNANGLVGRYFMEHPHFTHHFWVSDGGVAPTMYQRTHPVRTFDDATPDGIEVPVVAAMALPRTLLESEELPSMAVTFSPRELGEIETGDVAASHAASLLPEGAGGASLWKMWVRCEQRPNYDSQVRLSDQETDALGAPRVVVDWRVLERDIEDYKRILVRMGAELARNGAGRLWIPLDADGRMSDFLEGGCHHMSTTRMHTDPAEGVVDPDCKVHGIDNLYVAGSSVFPTGGFANPTMTIVALAHRLADHLLGAER